MADNVRAVLDDVVRLRHTFLRLRLIHLGPQPSAQPQNSGSGALEQRDGAIAAALQLQLELLRVRASRSAELSRAKVRGEGHNVIGTLMRNLVEAHGEWAKAVTEMKALAVARDPSWAVQASFQVEAGPPSGVISGRGRATILHRNGRRRCGRASGHRWLLRSSYTPATVCGGEQNEAWAHRTNRARAHPWIR